MTQAITRTFITTEVSYLAVDTEKQEMLTGVATLFGEYKKSEQALKILENEFKSPNIKYVSCEIVRVNKERRTMPLDEFYKKSKPITKKGE